jgi:hypothetical protein
MQLQHNLELFVSFYIPIEYVLNLAKLLNAIIKNNLKNLNLKAIIKVCN